MRMGAVSLTVLVVVALIASAAATGSVARAHGKIIGTIELGGGPAAPPGTSRPALGGEVSVFRADGRLVARLHVRAGHRFEFALRPGSYWLNAGRRLHYQSVKEGCPPVKARVRSGTTTRTHVYVGCGVP
jgi:hypothetical protein